MTLPLLSPVAMCSQPVRGTTGSVGLLSLRILVPVMQALAVSRSLNFLNAEALSAALILDASIAVTVDAPLLRAGSTELLVGYRIVE